MSDLQMSDILKTATALDVADMATVQKLQSALRILLQVEEQARRLLANPKNLIQSGPRIAIEFELSKLDALRAIERAKETT